jgi:Tfp pilus assembly protein PilN
MISVNFASRNYRLIARIHGVLIAAIVILCVAMAGLLFAAVSLRRTVSAMDLKLKELTAADAGFQPVLGEREQLVKDLSLMSGLIDSRRFSWTRLLTNIESVVPLGVALKHVEFNPRDHTLALEGTAQSPEALRNLIVGLEKSSPFQNPRLKHQSVEKGSNSFNVVAGYREDASPVVAQGK